MLTSVLLIMVVVITHVLIQMDLITVNVIQVFIYLITTTTVLVSDTFCHCMVESSIITNNYYNYAS